jgi:hypothetical protein
MSKLFHALYNELLKHELINNNYPMKITYKSFFLLALLLSVVFGSGCKFRRIQDAITGATNSIHADGNSLFHRSKPEALQAGKLMIQGEIDKAGYIDFAKIYQREVFVKETKEGEFLGAYRYTGYSLFDLLNKHLLQKKNAKEFPPAIDAYIVVENEAGEKVSFSWSEIFHTAQLHQVLIATAVAPIQPYKKEVNYPIPVKWKLIAAGDFTSERFLDNPISISIVSFDKKNYPIVKGMKPAYSEFISLVLHDSIVAQIDKNGLHNCEIVYKTSFYGMGMGNHPSEGFRGFPLELMTTDAIPNSAELKKEGLICFVGVDGYRTVYSYSELFNRADGVKPILTMNEQADGGLFRIFHPTDFFADRSVKALTELYFFRP